MWMSLPIVCSGLLPLCLLSVELPLFLLLLAYGLALEAHAHLVHAVAQTFDDMKAVYDYSRIGKALSDDGFHGIREVHRNFLHNLTEFLRYLHQLLHHIFRLRPSYSGDECTVLAMPVLVGKKREQVFAVHTLVYAEMFAHVPGQQHPV